MTDVAGFRAAGHAWRLHCGARVIESGLAEAVARAGAKRAFVICSPSVHRRGDTVARIAVVLGERFAGMFDGIGKDSTYASVQAARAAAAAASADLLIAAGGGSVIVAVRAVAILLAERDDPFRLMTQYPEGKPAFSPRLLAPKLPIINIPTTPTSAMNRAGTGLLNPDLDHRMEFFDPKTRPQAIFLDEGALMSVPTVLVRSTATTVFAGAVAALGQVAANPLAEGDRDQAFRLARRGYERLATAPSDPAPRLDLALAAFLQNRAEDDGAARFRGGVFGGDYAVSTALHLLFPQVGQGEATAVVHAPRIRLADRVDLRVARQVAAGLGVWRTGMDGMAAAEAVADALERTYRRAEMPTRLRDLGLARGDLAPVARATVKNFNANAGARSPQTQVAAALRLLEAAY